MDENSIVQRIRSLYADADIDINGEGCDLEIHVISEHFASMPVLRRQQSIMRLFADELASGKLHALSIKAKTKAEMSAASSHLVQLEL